MKSGGPDQFTCYDTTTPKHGLSPRPAFSLSLLLSDRIPLPLLLMSRRSAPMLPPPPPADRDIVMGPPPVPPQPLTPSSLQNSKDQREFSEKYYKLKRKYWELEEARSPSFFSKNNLFLNFFFNRSTRTWKMSSDVQASEIRIGTPKEGMRFSSPHFLSIIQILFLACSLTGYSNWKRV